MAFGIKNCQVWVAFWVGGCGGLFFRFLCVSHAGVVVVVVDGCVVGVSFLGCSMVLAVVGVIVFVVAVCNIRCSCGDICVVGIPFCSRNW